MPPVLVRAPIRSIAVSHDRSSGEDPLNKLSELSSDHRTTLTVVVPAYNEEKRLGATLKRMLAYFDEQGAPFEILVVDDGSTDGTAALVETIAACRKEVRLI